MKKRSYLSILVAGAMCAGLILSGCSSEGEKEPADSNSPAPQVSTSPESEDPDQAAADNVAALIDAIYVQQRTEDTDAQCTAAKEAWDALTDSQKELVSGEFAETPTTLAGTPGTLPWTIPAIRMISERMSCW